MVKVKLFADLDDAAAAGAGRLDRFNGVGLFERLDWFRLVAAHRPDLTPVAILAEQKDAQAWLFVGIEGRTVHALGNWYSLDYGAVVTGSGADRAALVAGLVRGLRRLRPRPSSLDLYPIAPDSDLPRALRRAGWIVAHEPASVRRTMATRGLSFADYWAGRPGRHRNTAERKARAAALDIALHDRFDAAAWGAYEAVYAHSWKPEEGAPAMLRALAEAEGAAGTLRLGVARKDGRPLAAQMWLTENGRATIHKLSYVADARALSPGTILSMAMFRHALEVDKVDTIDFGLGDDPYKADWIDDAEAVHRLVAIDPLTIRGAGLLSAKLVKRMRSG